jgi:hypothetical protein
MEEDSDCATKRKNDSDDPSVHWERYQQSHQKRVKQVEEEKDKHQNEIATMNSVIGASGNISDDDIIEIDAGGKIIRALRSTLCLAPDTMFTYMFSGRWEESLKRDDNGRVFLDHDPEFIEIIVNFLRKSKIKDPTEPVQSPKIKRGKKKDFDDLLRYFGLTDFFSSPSPQNTLDIAEIDVVQPHGSSIVVTKCEKKIQFSQDSPEGNAYFVACKPSLNSSGEGCFWKVTIDTLPDNLVMLLGLGIIGNLNASRSRNTDSTFYGWRSRLVWTNGSAEGRDSDFTGFSQGECLYFHLKSNKLTMFSVEKNRKLVIDMVTTSDAYYYIYFNLYVVGTKISLEPLNEDEQKFMLEK